MFKQTRNPIVKLANLPRNIKNLSITQPCNVRYLIRSDIKGTTREKKNYSTAYYRHDFIGKNKPSGLLGIVYKGCGNIPKTVHSGYNKMIGGFFGRGFHILYPDKDDDTDSKKEQDQTSLATIEKDIGLQYFLKKVYAGTGIGFSGALLTSLAFAPLVTEPNMAIASLIIGSIGAFGSVIFFNKSEPTFVNKIIEYSGKNITTIVPEYSTSKYASSVALCASMGLVMSPLVMIAGPILVAEAAGISVSVMIGSSLYAMYAKPGSLLPYKSVAYGALSGLVCISLASVGAALIFGANDVFYLLHNIDLWGGLALFTALNAIDTHNAIDIYKKGYPDYLRCSIEMILNALNIFIRVLEILAKSKK